MNNPVEILTSFDRYLEQQAELTLFGRSALALGFPNPEPRFAATQDVDAILSENQLERLGPESSFWSAQEATNAELKAKGLYITHLFNESDVIIQPDWVSRRVPISISFERLQLFRPDVVDLILTKMMRGDTEDLHDIRFLLRQASLSTRDLQAAFARARVPELAELHDIFQRVQPKVLALADEVKAPG